MNNPLFNTDFYKTGHYAQYPDGTEEIYNNFTPRSNKIALLSNPDQSGMIVVAGIQPWLFQLEAEWQEEFFKRPVEEVVGEYLAECDMALGAGRVTGDHVRALHALGYLPIEVRALPEGSLCPIGVPPITIRSTDPAGFWLPNYLETEQSVALWMPMTSATTAFAFRRLLEDYARETGGSKEFVKFQGHDFSYRGHGSRQSAIASGIAHLSVFSGTDTVPAIPAIRRYYGDKGFIGGSVAATEHSVMCAGGQDDELATYRRLLTEVYPAGIVSVVSDTWDYWKVLTEILPKLKSVIMERDGRLVVRPDSGDPVAIVCGDPKAPVGSPAYKGTIELLWELFGGTTNAKGYRTLDTHIGCIYGDSINYARAEAILEGLKRKGFASDNIVFGIGSFTYQYVTRDTYGWAVKATSAVVNKVRRALFKDPATDNGTKRSAKGLLRVVRLESGALQLRQDQTEAEERQSALQVVYRNSEWVAWTDFATVQKRVDSYFE